MDRALNVKSVKELKTKVLSSNLITDFLTVFRALNYEGIYKDIYVAKLVKGNTREERHG